MLAASINDTTLHMTKTVLHILILMLLWSCNQTNGKKQPTDNDLVDTLTNLNKPEQVENSDPKLIAYKNYVLQLDSFDAESSNKAANKLKEIFAGQSTELCDSAFVIFNELYESLDRNLNEKHQNDTTNYDPLVVIYDKGTEPIIAQKLKDYNRKLKKNGFEVAMDEGITFIKQDRDFISANFYSLVSSSMKMYLIQLNKENKEGFTSDGGLIISTTQLAERIIWFENFKKSNSKFIFRNKIKEIETDYLSLLLIGTDNTPLYDYYETKKLSKNYAEAYQLLVSKYPNSQTTKLVKPYFLALKQNQTAKAEDLLKLYKAQKIIY
jgi:hypothetical protein